ncbi:unnamed protein product [Pleuronectes platessa]|uniref:Uncharacterized protein n=1 Tax=Pleuronectes platessa TaxID=8262 RepID=A0A9N7VU54_PLEPL|nr:unnamed protein product [Pleuronectes platessa]
MSYVGLNSAREADLQAEMVLIRVAEEYMAMYREQLDIVARLFKPLMMATLTLSDRLTGAEKCRTGLNSQAGARLRIATLGGAQLTPDLPAVPQNAATPPALSDAIEAHCQQSAPGQGDVAA